MSKRTTEAYISALKYVHENLIPLVGKGIIIDFEKAMRAAIKRINNGIRIYGCWFHFCQSLRRKVASLKELFELIRNDSTSKHIFRRFQCLALLPAYEIEQAFISLSREALQFPHFVDFVDYFNDEWINRVKPQYFSVFLLDTRTTAAAEAFNGKSNKMFKTHGSFFHFCEILQKEEVTKATLLENEIGGSIQKNCQKKFYKKRSELIKEYSQKLQDGQINIELFLKTMANPKNLLVYSDSHISVLDTEVEISTNTELFEGEIGDNTEVIYRLPESESLNFASENAIPALGTLHI